ncbi:carbohydrate ABC transporter permease [Nonomuraea sp. NPDC050536]|uniref:carbohydrate ABC transporter permease n=1 Tax=Nonomuraea sp. NPDC050536 TaxID=3364366 RepID=UPI0037CA8BBF
MAAQLEMRPAAKASPGAARTAAPGVARSPRRAGFRRDNVPLRTALLWLGPAIALITGVVIYPAVELVKASTGDYSLTGLRRGSVGAANFTQVSHHPAFATVIANTAIWVFAVVAVTIVISLGLAQFLSKEFFGRKAVRWAVIVPWATSLIVTARLSLWSSTTTTVF